MLTDLDQYECPIDLKEDWINFPLNENFIFRIAVREVESWLIADIEGLSRFLNISKANFPLEPDKEKDPKDTLIRLAKRSRRRAVREDVVPVNDNAVIGPNYNGCLSGFVFENWSIENAIKRSESLKRAYKNLDEFKQYNPGRI